MLNLLLQFLQSIKQNALYFFDFFLATAAAVLPFAEGFGSTFSGLVAAVAAFFGAAVVTAAFVVLAKSWMA